MTEQIHLISTIKRQLRQQGKTYRDLAIELGLSEPSIKRLLSSGQLSVDRLIQVSHFLGFTLAEIAQEAALSQSRLRTLSEAQEKELVSDPKLLLVAACVLNHWGLLDIVRAYRLSETECLKRLLKLDKLHLINLLPGNRIRLNVSRDFEWLANGPIRRYFREEGLSDFLNGAFSQNDETLTFTHAMLTESATIKMQAELAKLRQRFSELHDESLSAPLAKRRGTGVLLAMREWEPVGFTALRR